MDDDERQFMDPEGMMEMEKRSRSRSPRIPRRSRSASRSRSRSRDREHERDRDRDERVRRDSNRDRRSRSVSEERQESHALCVRGLSKRTRDVDLEKAFSKHGKVNKVQLMVDPHTNESRLFAFVDMATHDDMERAMAKLHRSELDGRTISVEKARRGRPRTPTPGQYMGTKNAPTSNSGSRPYRPERTRRSPPRGPHGRDSERRERERRYSDRYDDRYDDRHRDTMNPLEMGSSIDTRTLFAATAAKYAALAQAGQPLFPPQYGASSSRDSYKRDDSYRNLAPPTGNRRDRSRSPIRRR